jgi:hypothetical protein
MGTTPLPSHHNDHEEAINRKAEEINEEDHLNSEISPPF